MPQKRNPVRSAIAVANAQLAKAHAAILLGAPAHEHERAVGSWQVEWEALSGALAFAGGAVAAAGDAVTNLEVDAERMRRNLEASGGLIVAERVSFALTSQLGRSVAHEVVAEAARATSFRDALLADERVGLTPDELDALLDPAAYLGAAEVLVDRALAVYERGPDMRLDYRLHGPEDAPVLVLSNSLGTTQDLWERQLPEFARHVRVLTYDHPGHGASALPSTALDRRGVRARADRAARRARARPRLRLRRVARSNGRNGARAGGADPGRAARPQPARRPTSGRPSRGPSGPPSCARTGWRPSPTPSSDAGSRPCSQQDEPETVARFHAMLSATPAEGYARCCEAVGAWDARERISAITAPVLVVAGADDPATPVEHAEQIAARIAGCAAPRPRARCPPRERRARGVRSTPPCSHISNRRFTRERRRDDDAP